MVAATGRGTLAQIQSEIRFATLLVETVTLETLVRQNGSNVAIELDAVRGARVIGPKTGKGQQQESVDQLHQILRGPRQAIRTGMEVPQ
jgi:hypothetical protein